MNSKPFFTGVCTALVTPFTEERVNYPMMQMLVHRQIAAGIPALAVCGTTGEAPALTQEERRKLITAVKDAAGDGAAVIAGAGSNNTEQTVTLCRQAGEAGADALLLVSPYYNKGNPDGLLRHFDRVAKSVDLPIILYNVPGRTGCDMSPELYKALSGAANIVGVKEACADVCKIGEIRHLCGNNFGIWTGNDRHALPAIALGADGVISVLSNLYPLEASIMVEAAESGDCETARAYWRELAPIEKALFSEVNPIPAKAAMKILGYDCGPCRLPLGRLSPDKEAILNEILF